MRLAFGPRRVSRLIAWLSVTCCLVGVLAHVFTSAWQPWVLVAALSHQLMWLSVPAVIGFAFSRDVIGSFTSGIVLIAVVVLQLPLSSGAAAVRSSSPSLEVLQANLHMGSADAVALTAMVRRDQVDVLTTEELTVAETQRLREAGLRAFLPYFFAAYDELGRGLGIWSRYPLSDQREYDGFQLGVLSAAVHVTGHSAVSVYAIHIMPPYPYAPSSWSGELRRLGRILAAAPTPLVAAGDFNATPDNAQYRHLLGAAGVQDAATQARGGYLATFPSNEWYPPLIAIDHVLVRAAGGRSIATQRLHGSDHRAVLATLSVPTSAR